MAYLVPHELLASFNDRDQRERLERERKAEMLRQRMNSERRRYGIPEDFPYGMTGEQFRRALEDKYNQLNDKSASYNNVVDATIGMTVNHANELVNHILTQQNTQNQTDMTVKQITNKQTLVLTIEELYRVIPNTKKLEGYNFKDLKELLVKLIGQIEEGGNWEFVQYINNKPSYFVVREITTKEVMYTHQENPYEAIKESSRKEATKKAPTEKLRANPISNDEVKPEDSVMSAPSITFTKLPWE